MIHPKAMPPGDGAHAFWAALAVEHRPPRADDVATHVSRAWQRARAAHPAIGVTEVELMTFAGERIQHAEPGVELERRHVEDLYLACACAHGDRAALAALETSAMPVVDRGLRRIAGVDAVRDDILQRLREQMLVRGEHTAGIAAYDGRAPLGIWLRVCAVRIGMRLVAKDQRDDSLDDTNLEELAPGVPDPELAYMKRRYGEDFRTAFAEAVTGLEPRQRNLLRHAVIDELGIDQIAAIYHVHRATAARQLKQAREALIAATRERMRATLAIGDTELDSVLRVLASLTDVTMRDLFRGKPGT